ncbi:hypothetical protein NHP21005_11960 [Helicobacter sp. NHP21005]|uniref:disulfide bond formation protein B n=1 Tax=Helicobacter felistomachi TaxID=3040201 RepID=UPI002573063A|nr:disulfide bond formation protein B [Helicobacter sp. NHP21005]BEG57508.1 hypothetical protein NHP21005_11960 [Helicobacter sp. NHP21005]
MQARRFYFLFSLAIIAIIALPVGIANLILGFIYHDSPCIQCWGERQSMVYVALGGLFVLRYGLKPKYIAMLVLVVAGGLYQSFYHSGNHALEDVGQGFALTIFGLHTQFWAEFVFWMTLLVLGVLLLKAPSFETQALRKLTRSNLWAFGIFSFLVASNMIQAFISTGPFPYLGHGDPIRFSWRMAENIWSTSNWGHMGFPRSLGKRIVDKPILAESPHKWEDDYHKAPLEIHKSLHLLQTQISSLKLNAPISDLNFLAAKDTPKPPKPLNLAYSKSSVPIFLANTAMDAPLP